HTEPQRGDARRVHLVGHDVHAAQDDLVESIGRKRLAQQERAPASHRKVDGREWSRPPACANERRAAAVDDIDRPPCYSAAAGRGIACDDTSPIGWCALSSCGEKSSTATAAATASAAARSCAASAALIRWRASASSTSLT